MQALPARPREREGRAQVTLDKCDHFLLIVGEQQLSQSNSGMMSNSIRGT